MAAVCSVLCWYCCCTVPERVPSFEADVCAICSTLWLRERKSNRSRTRAGPCGKLTACSCRSFPALLCNDCFILLYLPNPRILLPCPPPSPPPPRPWGGSGGNRDHSIPRQLPGKGKGGIVWGPGQPDRVQTCRRAGRGGRAGGPGWGPLRPALICCSAPRLTKSRLGFKRRKGKEGGGERERKFSLQEQAGAGGQRGGAEHGRAPDSSVAVPWLYKAAALGGWVAGWGGEKRKRRNPERLFFAAFFFVCLFVCFPSNCPELVPRFFVDHGYAHAMEKAQLDTELAAARRAGAAGRRGPGPGR